MEQEDFISMNFTVGVCVVSVLSDQNSQPNSADVSCGQVATYDL